jgi:hypothetical protein
MLPTAAAVSFGGVVTAAAAAWPKACAFSCTMRVYSRRSRALGGQPPVINLAVRYAITTGADHAISTTCIHGPTHRAPGNKLLDVRFFVVISSNLPTFFDAEL